MPADSGLPEGHLSAERRQEIEGAARAATPGPWSADVLGSEGYTVTAAPNGRPPRKTVPARCGYEDWETDKANARYIAAADPSTVLALLAELDRRAATIADLEAEREVLSVDEHGEDAVLGRDFYRCPNTGEWVYKWADERYVAVETLQLRELEARVAADTPKLQAAQRVADAYRSKGDWAQHVKDAMPALAAVFPEEPAEPEADEPPSEWPGFMAAGTQEFHRATCRLCLTGQWCPEATDG